MRITPHVRSGGRNSRRGFALLITITLLSFLVLLLVSLATLTRVETQVASNSQQLAQARQNALMALNIALGQLQKYAGPDRRTTGTADLAAGTASGTRISNNVTPNSTANTTLKPPSSSTVTDKTAKSKSLSKVQPGTRFWTGVWGNFDAPADIYQAPPRPVLLNWLVSGNESVTFTADGPTGKITTPNGSSATTVPFPPSLVPKETAGNVAISSSTTATTALTLGTTPAVLLVGPNTAGTAARKLDAPNTTITENAVDRYVVAPLVDIKAAAGSVPGLDSTATPVIGRYAYWIGDEGVKAKYNFKDPYSAKNDPYADPAAHYRIATAQRSGVETMDGFTSYPVNNTSLNKVISVSQVQMADTSLALSDAQKHFHDYTTTSRGVLADSQNSGLRKDLTYLLSDAGFSSAGLSGQPIIPTVYSPKQIIGGTTTYCPIWDWIKSFRDLPNAGNLDYNQSGSNTSVAIQAATATKVGSVLPQMGVAPVISFARMFVEANIIGDHVELRTRLAVILGNPYPVKLTGSNLKVKFAADDYYFDGAPANKQDSVCGIALYKAGSQLAFDGQTTLPKLPLFPAAAHNASVTGITQSAKSLLGQVTFSIPSINLPPGKQKIYSIASNQDGTIDSASTITLSEGDNPNVAYMRTVVPSGSGWPTISTIDSSTNKYTIRLSDSGNFSISLRDANDVVVTKHQHIDIIGTSTVEGSQDWVARDESITGYKALGGFDYYPIWPGQVAGTGGSTSEKGVQIFADYNLRAASMVMPKSSMPRYGLASDPYGNGFHTRPPYYAAPNTASLATSQFGVFIAYPPPWGYDWKSGTVQEVALFDLPRRDPANDGGTLLSLGFLQHANLTADDENLNVGHQPGAAFGNSRFNPYVRQGEVITGGANDGTNNNVYDAFVLQATPCVSGTTPTPAPSTKTRFFDLSYLLNTALWDSYYLSTLPQATGSSAFIPGAADLPNSRLTFTTDYVPSKADLGLNGGTGTDHFTSGTRTLPGESTPARYQMIEGAFNVNSTSIQAWKSILASLRTVSLKNPAYSPAWNAVALNALPRAVYPWANKSTLPDENAAAAGQSAEDYAGFRDLTDTQLETLAENIVKQVRMRGPFLSLAHFINRSLNDTMDPACLAGPLQAAIDANSSVLNRPADTTSTFTGSGKVYPTTPTQLTPAVPNRLTGLPGWLSQADILQAMGSVISARSDTFCIRVYGEVRDPLNPSSTAPVARAWCEATVQRYPDYVDSADLPSATLGTPLTSADNRNFGRRFRVISFRWLTSNDI
jgi:hypothetical protein